MNIYFPQAEVVKSDVHWTFYPGVACVVGVSSLLIRAFVFRKRVPWSV